MARKRTVPCGKPRALEPTKTMIASRVLPRAGLLLHGLCSLFLHLHLLLHIGCLDPFTTLRRRERRPGIKAHREQLDAPAGQEAFQILLANLLAGVLEAIRHLDRAITGLQRLA